MNQVDMRLLSYNKSRPGASPRRERFALTSGSFNVSKLCGLCTGKISELLNFKKTHKLKDDFLSFVKEQIAQLKKKVDMILY